MWEGFQRPSIACTVPQGMAGWPVDVVGLRVLTRTAGSSFTHDCLSIPFLSFFSWAPCADPALTGRPTRRLKNRTTMCKPI